MREPCLYCVRKHLAQALVLICESRKGYSENLIYAIGHLAEAEDEAPSKKLANEIREIRLQIEDDSKNGYLLLGILKRIQKEIEESK